jgi:archaellum component FlaC
MDCFLIKHCIWNENEEVHMRTISGFVEEAIQEYGYKVDLDFISIKEELDEFKKEVDTYTHEMRPIKHTINKIHNINNTEYFRILELDGKFNYPVDNLIEKKDIDSAKKDSFLSTVRHREDLEDRDAVYIKKGRTNHSLILSDDNAGSNQYELRIEVIDLEKNKVFTKKPHPNVEDNWDKRVDLYFSQTSSMKTQIEKYRNKDLEHLRTNLFVSPELANKVESHISAVQKEIGKIEVDIEEIQNSYKKLKDEEVVLDA